MPNKNQKPSKHKIPKDTILTWTQDALKAKQPGMLIVYDKQKNSYFPSYKQDNYCLWDTAVLLEQEGYEVVEFHVFIEEKDE